jgi:hypothetical protein
MKEINVLLACLVALLAGVDSVTAQSTGANLQSTVVFREPGFPAADSVAPSPGALEAALEGARFASAEQLGAALEARSTRLLVLPYGSAFPETAWEPIYQFLQRGGNLLVLGGRPFARAAYRGADGWKLREYGVRFMRPLMIDQYQETPGSAALEFQANPEVRFDLPKFAWGRAFSPVIRLSAVDLYHRDGAAGSIDARLDALVWGVRGGHKVAAPAIEVDHLRNGFGGGRWVFVHAELSAQLFRSTVWNISANMINLNPPMRKALRSAFTRRCPCPHFQGAPQRNAPVITKALPITKTKGVRVPVVMTATVTTPIARNPYLARATKWLRRSAQPIAAEKCTEQRHPSQERALSKRPCPGS